MSGPVWDRRKFFEELCIPFLLEGCEAQLSAILATPLDDRYQPILVSYLTLFDQCPVLGDGIINEPGVALRGCDDAAARALILQLEKLSSCASTAEGLTLKTKVHVRIHSLPDQEQLVRLKFPTVKDIGSFMCLVGTVIRTSSPKLLEYAKTYQCSKCWQTFEVEGELRNRYRFPKKLDKCLVNKCLNAQANLLQDPLHPNTFTKYRDYEEVRIQEQLHRLEFGSISKALPVILEDDLIESCKPGDDVLICGEVQLRWSPFRKDKPLESELCFRANFVHVNNNQGAEVTVSREFEQFAKSFWRQHRANPLNGRNHIIASFCPQVYGMYITKLALSVVLCGGVGKVRNGSRIRGQSHLLMVGDPGTGKSQLMKYVSKLGPRSVMTTGIGTTSAGLTVSATRDQGEWHLEAGALLLADGGICCIDEFSCIKECDRVSIHECMEQQTISVAKAGIVCKLSVQCTIIAATNPAGKYDPTSSVTLHTAIPNALLSRFDVILYLKDTEDEKWDSMIADFVLSGKTPEGLGTRPDLWDTEQMRAYFLMAKELNPKLTHAANTVLSAYYQHQRGSETRDSARTTVRLLESLIRLAEGHCRLMLRDEVMLLDGIVAIYIVESSMQGSGLLPQMNILHTWFPENTAAEYRTQARLILSLLNLETLWEDEEERLGRVAVRFGTEIGGNQNLEQQHVTNEFADCAEQAEIDTLIGHLPEELFNDDDDSYV